jgi:predicted membrane protein (TIGR00267 family)
MQSGELHRLLLHVQGARGIARRYFITNGFDGALTMLGLMLGFFLSEQAVLPVAIKACLGAAVALCMSGLSSAYLSESAERKKELHELEQALIADLGNSDVGRASRLVPVVVALVNGMSPLLISLTIMTPLWMAQQGIALPFSPFLHAPKTTASEDCMFNCHGKLPSIVNLRNIDPVTFCFHLIERNKM